MGQVRIDTELPLSEIRIDEELWGEGAEPVALRWLLDNYDRATMPRLTCATIKGREGVWLLGWETQGTSHQPLLTTIFGEEYARRQMAKMPRSRGGPSRGMGRPHSTDPDIRWTRELFESLSPDGGEWHVPRNGLVFKREDDKMRLTHHPGTPEATEELPTFVGYFRAAGIEVLDA